MLGGKDRPLHGKFPGEQTQPVREIGDVRKRDPQRSPRQRPRVQREAFGVGDVLDDFAQDDVIEGLAVAQQIGRRVQPGVDAAPLRKCDARGADVDADAPHPTGSCEVLQHRAIAAADVEDRFARPECRRDQVEPRLQCARAAMLPIGVVIEPAAERRGPRHPSDRAADLERRKVGADQRAFQRGVAHDFCHRGGKPRVISMSSNGRPARTPLCLAHAAMQRSPTGRAVWADSPNALRSFV